MTTAPSLTITSGMASAPPLEASPKPPAPGRDAAWQRALGQAEDGDHAHDTAGWTAPQDAPMQGLTASGDTVMRQSAIAMTIGLVSRRAGAGEGGDKTPATSPETAQLAPAPKNVGTPKPAARPRQIGALAPNVAVTPIQPRSGAPMPAASVAQPGAPAGKVEGKASAARSEIAQRTPVLANAPTPEQPDQAGALTQRAAVTPIQAATPIAALKAMIQAQLGSTVAMAGNAAAALSRAVPSSGNPAPVHAPIGQLAVSPGSTSGSGAIAAAASNDLIALPPTPSRAGIVQLTSLAPPAAVAETAEAVMANDLVPPTPAPNRSGIVQLTGIEGPEGGVEAEEAGPAEPEQAASAPDAAGTPGAAEPAAREPVRLHAEWSEQGVKIWLGADADQLSNLPVLAQQVQQWLASQGERLLSLVCNGQDVATEAEAGLDLANQSGEVWAVQPLPRPASLSDSF